MAVFVTSADAMTAWNNRSLEKIASLEARVTELEALLTFGLDYLKGGNPLSVSGGYRNGHLREQFRAALKDIPDA